MYSEPSDGLYEEMRTTISRRTYFYLVCIAICFFWVYQAMYLTKWSKHDVTVSRTRRTSSHADFGSTFRTNDSRSSTFMHTNHSDSRTNHSTNHTIPMHLDDHSNLSMGTSSIKDEIHADLLVSMTETEPLQLDNLCAYVDKELLRIQKEPWRNGSKDVPSGVKVMIKSGEDAREWFIKHESYGRDWVLGNESVDQEYDRMYRERGRVIFQKNRFSPNAFKAMQGSSHKVYQQNTGEGINTENASKLDAGLVEMSGISSWPAVMVFQDANINPEGHVQTHEIIMANAGCSDKNVIAPGQVIPSHDLVISVAQFWGSAYYHVVYENIIRLAPLLNITDRFQQLMVHVNQPNRLTAEYLQYFGIPYRRIITGNANARILIVPQPVLCWNPSTVLLRVLRQVVLRKILSTSTTTLSSPMSHIPNCRVLVIRRDGTRRVTNHKVMFKAIEDQHPDCEVLVHTGNEPLKSQLELFRRATSIVGPHGAGLMNMLVSRLGTCILEFLTIERVSLVFMTAAAKLGLQYWALAFPDSSHNGPMTANVTEVLSVVKEMVTYASKEHVPR